MGWLQKTHATQHPRMPIHDHIGDIPPHTDTHWTHTDTLWHTHTARNTHARARERERERESARARERERGREKEGARDCMHIRDRQTGRPETMLKTERETGFQANPTPTPSHSWLINGAFEHRKTVTECKCHTERYVCHQRATTEHAREHRVHACRHGAKRWCMMPPAHACLIVWLKVRPRP